MLVNNLKLSCHGNLHSMDFANIKLTYQRKKNISKEENRDRIQSFMTVS